jgi:hypothetical protein
MARWSRSRLRAFGVGAVACLGGSLLIIPAVSHASDVPLSLKPVSAPVPDKIATVMGKAGHSAFQFKAGSGDHDAPFGFVSAGGTVSARRLGSASSPMVQTKVPAPKSTAKVPAAKAAAATYATTLTIDSANWSAQNKLINVWNTDTWSYVSFTNPPNSLSATAKLAPGHYYATAMYGVYQYADYLLAKSFTVTAAAQTVHLTESAAKQVALTVDDTTAHEDMSSIWISLPNSDLVGFAGGPQTKTYVSTASVAGTTLRAHNILTRTGSTALSPSPYRYDLVKSWAHPFPAAPTLAIKTASLAKTTTTIRAQGVTVDGDYQTVPVLGEWTGVFLPTTMRLPASFTEYVTPGVTFSRNADYGDQMNEDLILADRTLPVGVSTGETVGAGPLAPGRQGNSPVSNRSGDKLLIYPGSTLGDTAGHAGFDSSGTTQSLLSTGGDQLRPTTPDGSTWAVSPDEQTYQLDQTYQRKVAWSQLSTKISSEWTFASSGSDPGTLPLMDVGFTSAGLDNRNRAGSAPVVLTLKPSTRFSGAASTVDKVEVSYDDGVTWDEVPLTAVDGGGQVSLTVPATAAFVSLRISAGNADGGTLRRTITRALAGPATAGDETIGSTTISNVKVNNGVALVPTAVGTLSFPVTFTASDPSGVARAGLYLWHGSYNTPDGMATTAPTTCTPVNATTSTCAADVYIWDLHYTLATNALAGAWKLEAWASAKDAGTGFVDRHSAGSVAIKQATRLTGNATPEPVKKGKTITVTGAQSKLDWPSWTYKAYASQTMALQWAKAKTSTWTTVKSVKAGTTGALKTTVVAGSDGSYRYSFAGNATANKLTSVADYVDVQ